MSTSVSSQLQIEIAQRFRSVRCRTLELCKPLTPEDMMVQSCAEASPAKWHLAHTAWFFESFILQDFLPGYELYNEDFPWLFNSYYRSFAEFPEKRLRSSFSRPGLDEVLRYRSYVDEAIERLLEVNPEPEVLKRIELGANHEEQHQELMLTDILHAFYTNPLRPVYRTSDPLSWQARTSRIRCVLWNLRAGWWTWDSPEPGSVMTMNCRDTGFGWSPCSLANRLVTNREFARFIADGGYRKSELWLSAGWDAVEQNGWRAPLYWNAEGERLEAVYAGRRGFVGRC